MTSKNTLRQFIVATCAILALTTSAVAEQSVRQPPRRPGQRVVPDPVTPRHSAALRSVNDCDGLRSYVVEVAVERIIDIRYSLRFDVPWLGGGDGREENGPTDYTVTNNQEETVDELDIVKTNGSHLYAVEEDTLHILQSWPAEATTEIASVTLGEHARGLFLNGNRVLAISQEWTRGDGFANWHSVTVLQLLDVSDPAAPQPLRTIEVEGWMVSARMIGNNVYLVLHSDIDIGVNLWEIAWLSDLDLPHLPWDATEEEREKIFDEARAILTPVVEDIVAEKPVEDFIPKLYDRSPDNPNPPATALLSCDQLYKPAEIASWSVLSVLHLDIEESGPVSGVGLLADGWSVYASAENLYVAQSSLSWWWGWNPPPMTTTIHKFKLDAESEKPVQYAATGEVDGWTLSQFAFSEYEGYLRVATTEFDWWWGSTDDEEPGGSAVFVLSDDGEGILSEVGRLDGLAPGEQIFAVRFMGATGYIVTFEQVDPLFTVDLSDPTHPEVIGELKVTGFSSYLHPMGDDRLLAVGIEADEEGRSIGLSVSVFDVRDLANPTLTHRYLIEDERENWSWSEALHDHHAFTYHRGVLSIPAYVQSDEEWFHGLIVLSVDQELGISELGRVDHADLIEEGYSPRMRRSVYIEDFLYSLSTAGFKVNELFHPEVELAVVPFAP